MQRKMFLPCLLLETLCINSGITQNVAFNHSWEVSVAAGVAWPIIPNSSLAISPLETDSNIISQSDVNATGKIGVGLYLFENTRPVLAEINVYKKSTTLNGNVWQYELPQFNNYSFNTPIKTTSVMLDLKPSFFSWNHASPYAILGLGMAWNTASYAENVIDNNTIATSALYLPKNTTMQFAANVGAGFRIALTERLNATAEYIYNFSGSSSPMHGIFSAPNYSIRSQSLLFGLSLKL